MLKRLTNLVTIDFAISGLFVVSNLKELFLFLRSRIDLF
jgi:hypothetical protein